LGPLSETTKHTASPLSPHEVIALQLYYFLVLLLSLSFGSLPTTGADADTAIDQLRHAALFTALVVVAWWTLCYLSVRMVVGLIEAGEVSSSIGVDWFNRHTECFRWLSLGLVFLCLGGFGLGRDLDAIPVLGASLAAQSGILLLPAILMMTGIWAAEYWFGVCLGWTDFGWLDASRWLWASLRCTIGWLVVPIVGVLAALDLFAVFSVGGWVPGWVPAWMLWIVMIGAAVAGIPWAIRRVFPTRPPDDATRQWIESMVQEAGLRGCSVVVWETGGRSHNAMIAGLLGRFRVLMVSDRLVTELSREQLAMVILHEAAHAARYHVPLRIAALAPVWLLGSSLQHFLGQDGVPDVIGEWAAMIGAATSLAGTVLVLRWVSYISEYDADAAACRIAPAVARRVDGVPSSSGQAARVLAVALHRVTEDCAQARRPTWLHPGIRDRMDRLTREHSPAGELMPACVEFRKVADFTDRTGPNRG